MPHAEVYYKAIGEWYIWGGTAHSTGNSTSDESLKTAWLLSVHGDHAREVADELGNPCPPGTHQIDESVRENLLKGLSDILPDG